MPSEDTQFDRIFRELELLRSEMSKNADSLQGQIRSMQASINSNSAAMSERVTTLERDFAGFIQQRELLVENTDEKFAFLEGGIKEMSLQLGADKVKLETMEKVHEQAKGAAKVWKVFGSGVGLLLVLANLYHLLK